MAEVGKWAKYSVTGLAAPTTTAATIDFTEVTDANNIVTRKSAGVYNVDEAGVYVIDATGIFRDTSNGRHNPAWDITLNGVVVAGSPGSGYNRNNANPYAWTRAGAILDLAITDEFSIRHYRDADTPTGTYDQATFRVAKVAATGAPLSHAGTPASAAYGGTVATRVTGWNAISESDTAAIQISTNGVTLKNGQYYLFFASMVNSDAGGARTGRMLSTLFDSGAVEHAQGQAYQRDASNQYAFPNTWGLVKGDGTGQLLEFLLHAHTSPITPNWSDGSWVLSAAANAAGFMVVELDAGAAAAIYGDATGGQTISTNTTLDLNVFRTVVNEDAPFSRVSNTAMDVTSAIETFGWAALSVQRTVASATRLSNAGRFVVETVAQADTEYGDYTRGDNWPDHWNCALGSTLVASLALNDTINFQKFDPITDDGSNDFSITGGSFFVDLGSLIPSGQTIVVGGVVETEVAQVVTVSKPIRVSIGVAVESETAQLVSSVKTIVAPVGGAVEVENAETVVASKTAGILVSVENEVAEMVVAAKAIVTPVGGVAEVEVGQPIAISKPIITPIGGTVETETPGNIPPSKIIPVGDVSETELSSTISPVKPIIQPVSPAVETETSGLISPAKLVPLPSAVETETSGAISPVKPIIQAVNAATENEVTGVVSSLKQMVVGGAVETETSGVITSLKAIVTPVGGVVETELAQNITPLKPIIANIGGAVETEIAQIITALQAANTPIGGAVESETVSIVTAYKTVTINVVSETEIASPTTPKRLFPINGVIEAELSSTITAIKFPVIGGASESETASLIAALKTIITPIIGSSESNLAGVISIINSTLISIGAAVESETAGLISPVKTIITSIGGAVETELAQIVNILSLHKVVGSAEFELAQAFVANRLALIGFAAEVEYAGIIGAPTPPAPPTTDSNNPNRIFSGSKGRIYVNVEREALTAGRVLISKSRQYRNPDRRYAGPQ